MSRPSQMTEDRKKMQENPIKENFSKYDKKSENDELSTNQIPLTNYTNLNSSVNNASFHENKRAESGEKSFIQSINPVYNENININENKPNISRSFNNNQNISSTYANTNSNNFEIERLQSINKSLADELNRYKHELRIKEQEISRLNDQFSNEVDSYKRTIDNLTKQSYNNNSASDSKIDTLNSKVERLTSAFEKYLIKYDLNNESYMKFNSKNDEILYTLNEKYYKLETSINHITELKESIKHLQSFFSSNIVKSNEVKVEIVSCLDKLIKYDETFRLLQLEMNSNKEIFLLQVKERKEELNKLITDNKAMFNEMLGYKKSLEEEKFNLKTYYDELYKNLKSIKNYYYHKYDSIEKDSKELRKLITKNLEKELLLNKKTEELFNIKKELVSIHMKIDSDKKYLVEVAKRLEEDINIVENKNYLLNKEKQQVNRIIENIKEEKEFTKSAAATHNMKFNSANKIENFDVPKIKKTSINKFSSMTNNYLKNYEDFNKVDFKDYLEREKLNIQNELKSKIQS